MKIKLLYKSSHVRKYSCCRIGSEDLIWDAKAYIQFNQAPGGLWSTQCIFKWPLLSNYEIDLDNFFL